MVQVADDPQCPRPPRRVKLDEAERHERAVVRAWCGRAAVRWCKWPLTGRAHGPCGILVARDHHGVQVAYLLRDSLCVWLLAGHDFIGSSLGVQSVGAAPCMCAVIGLPYFDPIGSSFLRRLVLLVRVECVAAIFA